MAVQYRTARSRNSKFTRFRNANITAQSAPIPEVKASRRKASTRKTQCRGNVVQVRETLAKCSAEGKCGSMGRGGDFVMVSVQHVKTRKVCERSGRKWSHVNKKEGSQISANGCNVCLITNVWNKNNLDKTSQCLRFASRLARMSSISSFHSDTCIKRPTNASTFWEPRNHWNTSLNNITINCIHFGHERTFYCIIVCTWFKQRTLMSGNFTRGVRQTTAIGFQLWHTALCEEKLNCTDLGYIAGFSSKS